MMTENAFIIRVLRSPTETALGTAYRTVRELIRRIEAFVSQYNRTSHASAQTATADAIFAKVRRLIAAISESQH